MGRLSRFVLAHRVAVSLFWLAITVVGFATVATTTNRLSVQFSVPGREGFETSARIQQLYGISNEYESIVAVVQLPQGTTADSPGVLDQLRAFDARIQSAGGTAVDGTDEGAGPAADHAETELAWERWHHGVIVSDATPSWNRPIAPNYDIRIVSTSEGDPAP